MAAGANDPHGDGTMGSVPSQGIFLGNLALALLGLTILVPVVILINAALHGFS